MGKAGGERDGELTLPRFFDNIEIHLIKGVRSVDYLPEMSF
jgi:hypothetical protein